MNELITNSEVVFTALLREAAREEAPRPFAIVEEYGERSHVRVAGYGLAYADHAQANSIEGDFPLRSHSVENVRTLFEISSQSAGVRRAHLVWLDETTSEATALRSSGAR